MWIGWWWQWGKIQNWINGQTKRVIIKHLISIWLIYSSSLTSCIETSCFRVRLCAPLCVVLICTIWHPSATCSGYWVLFSVRISGVAQTRRCKLSVDPKWFYLGNSLIIAKLVWIFQFLHLSLGLGSTTAGLTMVSTPLNCYWPQTLFTSQEALQVKRKISI